MSTVVSGKNSGLVCQGLTKKYGNTEVLKTVDLTLRPGEVVGLIGENGAGKSTFNSIIAGIVKPTAGKMILDGEIYNPETPSDAIDNGVALIHQEIRLLPNLSIAENIFLGRLPMKNGRYDRAKAEEESRAVLASLGIDIDPRRTIKGMSLAIQQGIEIAKAVSRQPRYVIFDEPTASVGAEEAEQIFEQLRRLKSGGAGIIYVSHRLDEITEVADRIMCLRDGAHVAQWDEMPVTKQAMIDAMVGRSFTFEHQAPEPMGDEIVLQVKGAGREKAFKDVSFKLKRGEILGFAGLIGAGRTEVVRALSGADKLDEGEIRVKGKKVKLKSPNDGMKVGIFMVPEDRKGLGLNLDRSAAANISLPWESNLAKNGMVTSPMVSTLGEKQKQRFDIRGSIRGSVGNMSGGNQQKVLLAKWLVEEPTVFIVDEPTRGVDVGAKMAIYEIIRELASKGMGIIVVSSELEEVLGLSHRVLVMSEGRQSGVLSREEATPDKVMSLAVRGLKSDYLGDLIVGENNYDKA